MLNLNYNFSHSGDMGDIVYSLPVIKYFGKGNLHINPSTVPLENKLKKLKIKFSPIKTDNSVAGISMEKLLFLKTLLEKQEYISKVNYGHNNISTTINLDNFRKYEGYCSIYNRYRVVFDIPINFYESPWITAIPNLIAKVVISRSNRYQNKKFPWKDFVSKYPEAIFVGLEEEHKSFSENFGKIKFYKTSSAWDLACVIAGANLFVGNQSLPYSIAEGLKINTIQESCSLHPDCMFVRDNAIYFLNDNFIKINYLN